MSTVTIVLALILFLVIIFQIARANELSSILKGDENDYKEAGNVTGTLLLVFLVAGLIGVFYCIYELSPLLLPEASSIHGKHTDRLFWVTTGFTGAVFLITQILLFWFSYRYRESVSPKALFYPDNNKLEIIWTVIPSIVLTILIILGLNRWFEIFSPVPDNPLRIEVTGKQFQWIVRYPGMDGQFGPRSMEKVNPDNELGIVWEDPASHDDVFPMEIHLVVNRPVSVNIRALDVLHSFYLPHFRVKMDAVPGIPTHFWFTPTKTTKEMKELYGDDFTYELACAELCGRGHFNMRLEVIVETQEEFDQWLASQKPRYEIMRTTMNEADPDQQNQDAGSDKSLAISL